MGGRPTPLQNFFEDSEFGVAGVAAVAVYSIVLFLSLEAT